MLAPCWECWVSDINSSAVTCSICQGSWDNFWSELALWDRSVQESPVFTNFTPPPQNCCYHYHCCLHYGHIHCHCHNCAKIKQDYCFFKWADIHEIWRLSYLIAFASLAIRSHLFATTFLFAIFPHDRMLTTFLFLQCNLFCQTINAVVYGGLNGCLPFHLIVRPWKSTFISTLQLHGAERAQFEEPSDLTGVWKSRFDKWLEMDANGESVWPGEGSGCQGTNKDSA